ncbi:chromosome partitioning protein, ParB family [Rhizobium sp. RU20A]|uniref:plasmid partitioning protein RepB n=1 Tax=Rhizobium sp. RU20A TaxID=1907412 RepID=UPI000956645D|nr:plasmid partitioning protein RepB [Rhizobium sp. RU20A]SIR26691.1 chromosome partitioning protein, ParB family [Rhizobium sp. RU20A]
MARRTFLTDFAETGGVAANDGATTPRRVAVGGISKTLASITARVERADAIERQLSEGQTVVLLDPDLIDASFVSDRLERLDLDPVFVEQIRVHGQQVPILVRPHPDVPERYQVAYGHRRLAAARRLRLPVSALVRALSDDELVVAQGQENSARTDLTYIERALFAARLERLGFARAVIMDALSIDKAALSHMLGVTTRIPDALIEAIGPAPGFGRRRWLELADLLAAPGSLDRANACAGAAGFADLTSDRRMQAVLDAIIEAAPPARPAGAAQEIGPQAISKDIPVQMRVEKGKTTFVFARAAAPGFDVFVRDRLEGLYRDFMKQSGD